MNPTDILRYDHERTNVLFAEFQSAEGDPEVRRHVADELLMELETHARSEEKWFYPVLNAVLAEDKRHMISEAIQVHEEVKLLIKDLRVLDVDDPQFSKTFDELVTSVKHHVEEEERELFPQAEEYLSKEEQQRVGEEVSELKHQLSVTV